MVAIDVIAAELSRRAADHDVGRFREIRKLLHPGCRTTEDLFPQRNIKHKAKDKYVYHRGGRWELQFNIGFESRPENVVLFRHCLALSMTKYRGYPAERVEEIMFPGLTD